MGIRKETVGEKDGSRVMRERTLGSATGIKGRQRHAKNKRGQGKSRRCRMREKNKHLINK